MKGMFILGALCLGFIAAGIYNSYGPVQQCRYDFDASLNGLYIVKQRTCYGALGWVISRKTVERRPLFQEF